MNAKRATRKPRSKSKIGEQHEQAQVLQHKRGLPVISYSRLSNFMTCPRLEWYQYRVEKVGIEPKDPNLPFIEGNVGHYALAYWYKIHRMLRANLLNRVRKVTDTLADRNQLTPEVGDRLEVLLAAMIGACLGYPEVYRSDLTRFEVLYIEQPFEFEIEVDGVKILVVGRMDLVTRDKDTKLEAVWDHKFVGGVKPGSYVALPMNLQDWMYCAGYRHLTGHLPGGRQRNFILKSQLRQRKDSQGGKESLVTYEARVRQQYIDEPDKKFFRPPVQPVEEAIVDSVMEVIFGWIRRWLQNEGEEMNFGACLGMYGRPCPYIQACTAKLKGHKEGWNAPECRGLYRVKTELLGDEDESQAIEPELLDEEKEKE